MPFLPKQLTHLGLLHASKITDSAVSHFPSSLQSLSLGQTEILSRKLTKACLKQLPRILMFLNNFEASLNILHLRNIVLSGTGAQFLPKNLISLHLTYTHVTSEEIKTYFPNYHVESLGYSDYKLTHQNKE